VDAVVEGAEHGRVDAVGVERLLALLPISADVVVVLEEGRVVALGPAEIGEVVEAVASDARPEGKALLAAADVDVTGSEAALHAAVEPAHDTLEVGAGELVEAAIGL